MSIAEFNSLKVSDQAKLVWKATFLGQRHSVQHYALLYAVENFYVEVNYSKRNDQIISLSSFVDTTKLTPYLDDMKLKDLFA